MRHYYDTRRESYSTGPIISCILFLMLAILGYLVAFGETFRPKPTARVYLADMSEFYRKPDVKR